MSSRWIGAALLCAAGIAAVVASAAERPGVTGAAGGARAANASVAERDFAWRRTIAPDRRFQEALDGSAILDRETGLVWERDPDTGMVAWAASSFICYNRAAAGRRGWRLPTVEELESLIDPAETGPALPPGHPFGSVQTDVPYWSGTTVAGATSTAYGVSLVDGGLFDQMKTSLGHLWCVRGGHGHDGY